MSVPAGVTMGARTGRRGVPGWESKGVPEAGVLPSARCGEMSPSFLTAARGGGCLAVMSPNTQCSPADPSSASWATKGRERGRVLRTGSHGTSWRSAWRGSLGPDPPGGSPGLETLPPGAWAPGRVVGAGAAFSPRSTRDAPCPSGPRHPTPRHSCHWAGALSDPLCPGLPGA